MRFDFEPLYSASLAPTLKDFSEMAGVDLSAPHRWRKDGMSLKVAERLCDALRLHPSEVWTEWVDLHVATVTKDCAAPDCSETWIPKPHGWKRRFCSETCAVRTWRRERYASDEAWREREKERRRAYYAENGDYERARQRRADREAAARRRAA